MSSERSDLVRAARAGSDEALAELLAVCEPGVSAYLARLTGDGLRRVVSHSDLCQEVFLRGREILGHLPEGAGVDDFRGLLLQHARWTVGKAARKRQRFQGESVGHAEAGPVAERPAASASAGEVTRNDELAWLAQRIDELEPGLAEVVRLRLEDHTFGEIAEFLSIGEDAVRKRYLVAARRLGEAVDRGKRQ